MALTHDDRVLPWWLERQLDPTSPDVVPGPGATVSSTRRNWALLGTTGAPERAVVDPRGLVTPWPEGWSLDWWVGADDRWHLPSRSAGVRQRLVGDAPVVETVLRVPGGDVVHRAWAVAGGEGVLSGGAVVVELENASPVPVAVALSVRPWNALGAAAVHAVHLDGTTVLVDGRVAMVLPKAPSRVAVGDAVRDAVVPVLAGDAGGDWPEGGVRCANGEASAAFLFPLPHTAVLRVMVPLAPPALGPTSRRRQDPVAALSTADPRALPDATRVASGWEVQVRRSPRFELPEPRLEDATAAARRHLLLHSAGEDAGAWPPAVVGGLDTAALAIALDRSGLHTEAARLLVGYADRQGLDGSFSEETHRVDAAAAWLHAVGEHVRLSGSADLAASLVGPIAKAAHHLQRRHSSRRARRPDGGPNLLPPGASPTWVSGADVTYHDAAWAWRGLVDAAVTLDAAGQPEAAVEVAAFARSLAEDLSATLAADAARLGSAVPPAGPGGRPGFGTLGTVLALAEALAAPGPGPNGALDALLAGTAALAADDAGPSAVWHQPGHAGFSPRLTALLARAEVVAGADPASPAARLRWLLDTGAPLWAWPELVHPRTGGGCAGEGHHGAATAAVLDLVRSLVVTESAAGLDVLPAVPVEWYGQAVEAHGVPTAHGRLSFALRWHGERPALLWELQAHDDPDVAKAMSRLSTSPFRLRAPGLDPTWQSAEPVGEALLGVPPQAAAARPTSGASASETTPSEAASPAPLPEVAVAPPSRAAGPEPTAPAPPPGPPTGPGTDPDGGSSFT